MYVCGTGNFRVSGGLTEAVLTPGKGLGLFCTADLAEGFEVVRIDEPGRMSRAQWLSQHSLMGLPHDGAIEVARSVYFDAGWAQDPCVVPKWYRMNHSSCPTVRMLISADSSPLQRTISWVTTRAIAAGSELTYSYVDPDPSWVDSSQTVVADRPSGETGSTRRDSSVIAAVLRESLVSSGAAPGPQLPTDSALPSRPHLLQ